MGLPNLPVLYIPSFFYMLLNGVLEVKMISIITIPLLSSIFSVFYHMAIVGG